MNPSRTQRILAFILAAQLSLSSPAHALREPQEDAAVPEIAQALTAGLEEPVEIYLIPSQEERARRIVTAVRESAGSYQLTLDSYLGRASESWITLYQDTSAGIWRISRGLVHQGTFAGTVVTPFQIAFLAGAWDPATWKGIFTKETKHPNGRFWESKIRLEKGPILTVQAVILGDTKFGVVTFPELSPGEDALWAVARLAVVLLKDPAAADERRLWETLRGVERKASPEAARALNAESILGISLAPDPPGRGGATLRVLDRAVRPDSGGTWLEYPLSHEDLETLAREGTLRLAEDFRIWRGQHPRGQATPSSPHFLERTIPWGEKGALQVRLNTETPLSLKLQLPDPQNGVPSGRWEDFPLPASFRQKISLSAGQYWLEAVPSQQPNSTRGTDGIRIAVMMADSLLAKRAIYLQAEAILGESRTARWNQTATGELRGGLFRGVAWLPDVGPVTYDAFNHRLVLLPKETSTGLEEVQEPDWHPAIRWLMALYQGRRFLPVRFSEDGYLYHVLGQGLREGLTRREFTRKYPGSSPFYVSEDFQRDIVPQLEGWMDLPQFSGDSALLVIPARRFNEAAREGRAAVEDRPGRGKWPLFAGSIPLEWVEHLVVHPDTKAALDAGSALPAAGPKIHAYSPGPLADWKRAQGIQDATANHDERLPYPGKDSAPQVRRVDPPASGLEEQAPPYKNLRAPFGEVVRTLREYDQRYQIDILEIYLDRNQRNPSSAHIRNRYNPPPGYDFADFFVNDLKLHFRRKEAGEAERRTDYLFIDPDHEGDRGELYAEVLVNPPSSVGLEEIQRMEVEEFLLRYPGQVANVPQGTTHVLTVPAGVVVRLYRPETLASGLEETISREQESLPDGLQIQAKPIPPDASGVQPPAVFVWDPMLGNPPYAPPVPVVEQWAGQPMAHRLPKLVAIALFGRLDAARVQLLTVWTFEHEGRQRLVFAVQA